MVDEDSLVDMIQEKQGGLGASPQTTEEYGSR